MLSKGERMVGYSQSSIILSIVAMEFRPSDTHPPVFQAWLFLSYGLNKSAESSWNKSSYEREGACGDDEIFPTSLLDR